MAPRKQVAIHGHFYQPDRFIPQLHGIPHDSIAEVRSHGRRHNWNEVIYDECYLPNADAGNFSYISFDFYRPIFDWLKKHYPVTYRQILDQAALAKARDGVSNVFAGSYDHVILPQLQKSDLETEIYWGIADYIARFGERPAGFWLPETAVNHHVLEHLVQQKIQYIVLAPWQAKGEIDTSKVYKVLVRDSSIKVVFYNQLFSQGISFDSTIGANAPLLYDRYIAPQQQASFLLGVSDGERYGHHLAQGAQLLQNIVTDLSQQNVEIMTVAKFVASTDTAYPVRIIDDTSWSCRHQLQRWRGDCPCVRQNLPTKSISGTWKAILFSAIHQLARELDVLYMSELLPFIHDPLVLKKHSIAVLLKQKPLTQLIDEHAIKPVTKQQAEMIGTFLEIQRFKLASFTSCGFFFADIDRPEPRICIANAKQALSLLQTIGKAKEAKSMEKRFVDELASIKSVVTGISGKDVYTEYDGKKTLP